MQFFLPALATLALHGMLLVLLLVGLPGDERRFDLQPERTIINAKLVFDEKPRPQPVIKPKPKPVPKPQPKPTPKPVPKPEVKAKQAEPKPKEPSKEEKAKQEAEKLRQLEEKLRQEQQQELAEALNTEEKNAEADAQQEITFGELIAALVTNNWSRPPKARNGMVAVVAIETVPSGEVINQYIVESSGDTAFDLSVLRAVSRLGRIEELAELAETNTSLYERKFRRFQFKFNPQDLRR
ncbi:TonB family protein [Spongiibacter sp. KMU-158]|uniref:TonB family protein n=1 Tax=Spongiibacter pelagi TaxID=2760804 RepID=A0A927GX53_9GAMM|nr:TonB family protein [Spongiibacter pelagi]MBD2859803.1 TonB family protein [Spongiibacter pelagi]